MSSKTEARKKESFKIFDQIAQTYDPLNRLLSLGIDVYWRNKLKNLLPSFKNRKLDILDLATGTGDVALVLGKLKNVRKVRGIDLSNGMITIGKKKVVQKRLSEKVTLELGDGVNIPAEDQSYDAVTVSFGIRNFGDHITSLKNMHRVLRPGGRALIMEFSLPTNPIIRSFYLFYFRNILPLIGNILSKHGDAYSYLNKTVEEFPYGEEMKQLIYNAGFKKVTYYPLTFGIATIYCGEK